MTGSFSRSFRLLRPKLVGASSLALLACVLGGAALASARQVASPVSTTAGSGGTTPIVPFLSGVCGNFDDNPSQASPVATTGTEWDAMKTAGAKMVRVDAIWSDIEEVHLDHSVTYHWDRLDTLMALATGNSRGMNLLIILSYNHPAYSTHAYEPPLSGSAKTAWEAFVRAIVAKYPHAWFEVWNEPDIYGQDASNNWKGFWYPLNQPTSGNPNPPGTSPPIGPAPSEYVDLLVDTAAQIRSVVGFDGKILMGGIAYPSPRNYPVYPYQPTPVNGWIDAVLSQNIGTPSVPKYPASLVDALNIHTYVGRGDPGLVAEEARTFKAVLAAHSIPSMPFYVTEAGALDSWIVPSMTNDTYVDGPVNPPTAPTNLVQASDVPGSLTWTQANGDQNIQALTSSLPQSFQTLYGEPVLGKDPVRVTPATSGLSGLIARSSYVTAGSYYTVSVSLRCATSRRVLYVATQATSTADAVPVEVGPTWTRFSFTVPAPVSSQRIFQVFGDAGGPAWDIAAPMVTLCPGQAASGFANSLVTTAVSQKPAAIKRFMKALSDEGASGAFMFAWRDYGTDPSGRWGLADGSGGLKVSTAALTNCLVP